MNREREQPGEWSPRRAAQRYLKRRRADSADSTVYSLKYRLKLFVEWLEGIRIGEIGQLAPLDLDEYYDLRSGKVKPVTLSNEMKSIRGFLQYLEDLGAVDDGLSDSVRIPDLDPEDNTNEVSLRPSDALELIRWFRDSDKRGTRQHAWLELAWFTGARMGSIRALDLRDFNRSEAFVEFHHRPDTDTPLKNKRAGERPVALPVKTAAVVGEYIRNYRRDVTDDFGRQPLLATVQGRPAKGTTRTWSYLSTQPCLSQDCPHNRNRESCEWVSRPKASKCPSSRSPHRVRSGSITYQLNRGIPPAVVAARVNASVEVIEDHYDVATREARWNRYRERMASRRKFIDLLEVDL